MISLFITGLRTNKVIINDCATVVVPNIDIEHMVAKYGFETNRKILKPDELIEKLYYIISLIYNLQVTLGEKLVYFSSDKFKQEFGNDYKEYLDWLYDRGLLLTQNYSSGHHSMAYGIKGSGVKYMPLFKTEVKHQISTTERTEGLLAHFDHLTIVDHDVNAVLSYQDFLKTARKSFKGGDFKEWFELTKEKIIVRMMMSKVEMENKQFRFRATSNRLFTSVSMMKREQRQFLRYKGEKLIEVDMSNAMPFLALAIFLPKPFESFGVETLLPLSTKDEILDLINELRESEELGKYIDLVSSGELYDVYQGKVDRDSFKEQFFAVLFNKPTVESALKTKLSVSFPRIMKIFDLIKVDFIKTRKEGRKWNEAGNQLCKILYKIEATLFLEHIVNAFNRPCFTIHDAILTTEEYIHELKSCMLEVTKEKIGIEPTVKVKAL